LSEDIKY